MTRRELYLRALKREPVPALTWAPNFDHWLAVNQANGTVPAEYHGLSGNDLVRAVGGTIWRRVGILRHHYDTGVKVVKEAVDGEAVTRFITPIGEVRTRHRQAPDSSRAWFLVEHRVKKFEDLRVVKYLYEATRQELYTEDYEQQAREVGDDGLVLSCLGPVPFIEFAKVEVGYENAYYLLADHPAAVAELLAAMERNYLEGYRLAARGPCPVISNGDNMDQLTCPPAYFRRYAVPFYRQVREILHAGGQLAQGHWCGRLDQLLPLIPDCGLDIIEAMTPRPMTNLDMREAMNTLEGRVAVQGGLPAVYMCAESCSRETLADYVRQLLDQVGHCRGFVLGMGDNVPSNADFSRVKMISELVEEYNRGRTSH